MDAYGPWKFAEDDKIREVVGDNDTDLKISIMADVGRCNYKEDIHDRSDSPVDLIRVATYVNTMPAAIDMIEDAHRKGYETTCNIMAISNAKESDINKALEMLGKSCVDGLHRGQFWFTVPGSDPHYFRSVYGSGREVRKYI